MASTRILVILEDGTRCDFDFRSLPGGQVFMSSVKRGVVAVDISNSVYLRVADDKGVKFYSTRHMSGHIRLTHVYGPYQNYLLALHKLGTINKAVYDNNVKICKQLEEVQRLDAQAEVFLEVARAIGITFNKTQ